MANTLLTILLVCECKVWYKGCTNLVKVAYRRYQRYYFEIKIQGLKLIGVQLFWEYGGSLIIGP